MATALVTGGTAGIGAAFARALAARGDDLVLVARDAERLAAMAAEITERYAVTVEVIAADLGRPDDVQRIAKRVESTESPIDLLVNNAGFGVKAHLLDADTSVHERAIDVMVRAVLVLGGAAGRSMSERGYGAVVNVASTAAFVTMGGYSAIKAWVLTYSESLAVELHGTGVTVTALCPGFVRTELHQRAAIRTSSLPSPLWLLADDVVRDALADVARQKVISIPSRRYRLAMFLARHAPRPAIRAVSARLRSTRHE
ncbi:MAG: SDR family NAD(P)-dependent oxidoreductase [Actinomycetes bacterium]